MEIFREEGNKGVLLNIKPDPNSRYIATIWFDYNLKLMKNLQEGDFVAVQSFASEEDKIHYTILQIVKKLPFHFAFQMENKGYPGYIMEAARNASQDWINQINTSTEETTKVICEAIPINMGFYLDRKNSNILSSLSSDYSLPMPGKDVKILSYSFTEKILNKGLDQKNTGVTYIGHLQHNKNIKILLDIEKLIRLHFGIFGFTGAGKSNLISTLISKIMENSPKGTKVVIFDIMGEYVTLLIDLLSKYHKQSKVIGIGSKTFPQDLFKYYESITNLSLLEKATKTMLNTNLYPKNLLKYKHKFERPIKRLLYWKIFRVFEKSRFKTINEILEEAGINSISISQKDKEILLDEILPKYSGQLAFKVARNILSEIEEKTSKRTNTVKFKTALKKLLRSAIETKSNNDEIFISMEELINELNNEEKGIYIIQSHDPDELKRFVYDIATELYENRRTSGKIDPLILFILDEADEFIPQDNYIKGDAKISRQAVEMLARRGRKFGLGIGIATQRVVYLDTNIMAQPHTYFISKLPRSSDRERVAEAFALGDNVFEQTFKFGKGDWLLVSHDATGLEGIPFPIHTENAEERIIKFLEQLEKYRK